MAEVVLLKLYISNVSSLPESVYVCSLSLYLSLSDNWRSCSKYFHKEEWKF